MLLVSSGYTAPGWRCPSCDYIGRIGRTCPVCRSTMHRSTTSSRRRSKRRWPSRAGSRSASATPISTCSAASARCCGIDRQSPHRCIDVGGDQGPRRRRRRVGGRRRRAPASPHTTRKGPAIAERWSRWWLIADHDVARGRGVAGPASCDRDGTLRFAPNLPGVVELPVGPSPPGRGDRPAGAGRQRRHLRSWGEHPRPAPPDCRRRRRARHPRHRHRRRPALRRPARAGANGFAGEIGHMVVDVAGWSACAAGAAAGSATRRAAGSGGWAVSGPRPGEAPAWSSWPAATPGLVLGEHVTICRGSEGDSMEFRRINALPPYVFTIIDGLKQEARRAGRDVIDLGFGNPDLPSPEIAVDKLAEAAHNTRNHRYSPAEGASPSCARRSPTSTCASGTSGLDPETEVINTIGAKEGFSHLMWVLLGPGDAPSCPSPSYPIHIWGPLFAGADVRELPVGNQHGADFFEVLRERFGVLLAQAAGDRAVVPPQPDDGLRRPRVLPAGRRLRPRATTSSSCTTTPTPSSASTATSRRRSSRPKGPRSARSSCTR